MELREIATFREIARLGSFSRAATRLGYVQSTVTAQVQSLERDLGVQLFDRLPRSIRLTPAGQALLGYAEQIVELSVEARSAATLAMTDGADAVGSVIVSAPESLLTYRLPLVLTRLRSEHPGVRVELRPTPIGRFRSDTRRAVSSGEVDIAVVLDTQLAIPGFASEILIAEPISVIASPAHRLTTAGRVGPRDLDGDALLLPEAPDSGCAYRGQFERQLGDAQVSTDDAIQFASIETVKQCVAAGMGVSVVPSIAVEADLAAGRLVSLNWAPRFEVYTQLVWNERRLLAPAHAAFLNTARAALNFNGKTSGVEEEAS
jgi:DNA-binding transcriptional LysR family regulator